MKLVKSVQKLMKIGEIDINYSTPTYIYIWNHLDEPVKIFQKFSKKIPKLLENWYQLQYPNNNMYIFSEWSC